MQRERAWTGIHTGADVASYLKEQHERIGRLFARVLEASGLAREAAFEDLRVLLAVHEAVDEEVLHPAVRRALGGDAIVNARLQEENALATAVTELEVLDARSPQFEASLRTLRAAVVAHDAAEERTELDELAAELDEATLWRMRKAVQLTEAVAPSVPRPGLESAIENLSLGPFVGMLERARNALS